MFVCPNPSCPRRSPTFNSERGLLQHMRKSPICLEIYTQTTRPQTKRARICQPASENQGHVTRTEADRVNRNYPFISLADEFDNVADLDCDNDHYSVDVDDMEDVQTHGSAID